MAEEQEILKVAEKKKAREALISPIDYLPPVDKAEALMPGIKIVDGKAVFIKLGVDGEEVEENKPKIDKASPLPVKITFSGVDEEGKISIGFN